MRKRTKLAGFVEIVKAHALGTKNNCEPIHLFLALLVRVLPDTASCDLVHLLCNLPSRTTVERLLNHLGEGGDELLWRLFRKARVMSDGFIALVIDNIDDLLKHSTALICLMDREVWTRLFQELQADRERQLEVEAPLALHAGVGAQPSAAEHAEGLPPAEDLSEAEAMDVDGHDATSADQVMEDVPSAEPSGDLPPNEAMQVALAGEFRLVSTLPTSTHPSS